MQKRLEVRFKTVFNKAGRLFLSVELWEGSKMLETNLNTLLAYLFQNETTLNSDDAEFCYALAKCIKKVDIDGVLVQAIPNDHDMAMFFERAHQYGVHLTWINETSSSEVPFNEIFPFSVQIDQQGQKLICRLVDRERLASDPTSWLIFDSDGKIVCFCSGHVFIRPPQPVFEFINRLLDTDAITYSEKESVNFIKTIYRPYERLLRWRVTARLQSFVPEQIPPRPIVEVSGSDTEGIQIQIKYKYLNTVIEPSESAPSIRDRKTKQLIDRQLDMEAIYQQDVMALFLEHECPFNLESPGDKALLINRILPELRRRDWIVRSNVAELKIAEQSAAVSFTLHQSDDKSWFHFDPNCSINGERFSLQELARLMVSNKGYVKTRNGYTKLSDQTQSEIELLSKIGAFRPNQKFSQQDVVPLAVLTHTVAGSNSENFIKQIEGLRETPPTIDTSLIQAELRDYQIKGVAWMMALQKLGCGALLADDMGLGKTIQCITMLTQTQGGPHLMVGPTNVLYNWEKEVAKFAPQYTVKIYRGQNRERILKELKSDHIVVVSYGLIKNDLDLFSNIQFSSIILDEAQAIKNPETQVSKAVKRLRAPFKIALTGTPIENQLTDLWNIMDFLMPGYLGPASQFERSVKENQTDWIRAKIRPFIMRRVKKEVLDSLPEKIETNIYCELSESQEKIYQTVLDAAKKGILSSQGKRDKLPILTAILKLRQVCTHPGMLSELEGTSYESTKLNTIKETVSELMEEEHKVVIFSQFTKMLDILENWLKESGYSFERIDGSVNAKMRQERVDRFQNSTGSGVFLISLKAGGVGINLTAADYVIHIDPWWNPAIEAQATDRVHRMGQKNTVMVYRLIAKGTIEEKIQLLQKEKQALFAQIVDPTEAQSDAIDFDEIRNLLLA